VLRLLEVALTGKGEIFSWLGASHFDYGGIDHLVTGPMGTGVFGGFLSVVFKQDVRTFNFEQNTELEGHSLTEYAFQVAPENSSYNVQIAGAWVKSGYSGTVLVDPQTDDVVRMTVKTAKLPESSNVCEISADLNLQMVRIGDGQILLPSQARQHYVLTNGEETENTFTFGDAASTWANRA